MRQAWIPLVLLVPLACEQTPTAPEPAQSSPAKVETAPRAASDGGKRTLRGPRRGGGMRGRGPAGALFREAGALELAEDKRKKLDEIETTLRPQAPGGDRESMREMHTTMVDGIKAGKIDAAAVKKHTDELEKQAQARREREAEALNNLHSLLDPAQRKTVVEKVRSRQVDAPKRPDRPDRPKPSLERWTKDLGLDAEQEKKIQAVMEKRKPPARDPEARKKQTETLLAAFEKDSFDAKTLELGQPPRKMSDMAAHMNEVLAILTPAQREKLAASLQRGPGMGRPHPGALGRGLRGRGGFGFGFPGWEEGAEEDDAAE